MADNNNLPKFGSPPVIEVVCGLQFSPLTSMLTGHIGALWDRYKPDYSELKEAAPLPHVVEQSVAQQDHIKVSVSETPDLPRTWFVHKDGTGVLQVQRDRFLHNWRKVNPSDEYPSHVEVIRRFREHLNTFRGFLDELSLGPLSPDQLELTYINHIPIGTGWNSYGDIGVVLPDFAWRPSNDRFLPAFGVFNWRTSFPFPNQTGWLHVNAKPATRKSDNHPILYLELSARGMATKTGDEAMLEWFEIAHEWIVRGFTDLTGQEMHKVWNRTK